MFIQILCTWMHGLHSINYYESWDIFHSHCKGKRKERMKLKTKDINKEKENDWLVLFYGISNFLGHLTWNKIFI